MRFLKYLCAFCACRFLWAAFRGHSTRHAAAQPCQYHITGIWVFLLGLVAAPFIYGAVLAGLAALLHW